MPAKTHNRRAKALQTELERILPIIVSEYEPAKVIVFGSVATGEVGEWSDIDMVIVKETDERFFERIDTVLELIKPRLGIDLFVYTPAEFDYLSGNRLFFQKEVIPKAKVVYAR